MNSLSANDKFILCWNQNFERLYKGTACKVSKYGQVKTPYLDTFHAVEAYPGLPRTSKMDSFSKIVTGFYSSPL